MSIGINCSSCSINQLCLPVMLAEAEIEHLDSIVERKQPLQEGGALYRAGDSFAAVYAVRSGCLKSFTISSDGTQQITGFHLPGELVGLDALYDDTHHSYAEALQTSMICAIPYTHLERLSHHIPALRTQLMRIMSRELREDQELMMLLGKKSAEQRFAAFLVNLAARFRRRGFSATEFRLPMPRSDIGNYLGLAIETVSRLVKKMQEKGVIQVKEREVKIIDPFGLARMGGGSCEWPDAPAQDGAANAQTG